MKIESFRSSGDITDSVFNNYYPNGEMVVKTTSFAKDGIGSRTLTTRTLSDAMTGDTLYRSPKFSIAFYNRMVGSSLNSLVTGGKDSVFGQPTMLEIENPESTETKATLTGGTALNRIISTSILGRRGGSDLVTRSIESIAADIANAEKDPRYVAGLEHGSTDYASDGAMVSSGSRAIALSSALSSEERGWILERGAILKSKQVALDSTYLSGGFMFDLPDSLTGLKQTTTYYEGLTPDDSVDPSLISAGSELAYISPSLIELLLFLESKMGFKGALGADKASRRGMQNENYGPIGDGNSVNDHVFGRGFDFFEIVSKSDRKRTNLRMAAADVAKYRTALSHFLEILNTAPQNLIPDFIAIHSDLGTEFGIVAGNEAIDSPIKAQYPNLKYVNFNADANHKNNIHISFSAQRSGQYVGPGGALGAPGVFLTRDPNAPAAGGTDGSLVGGIPPSAPPNLNDPIFRKTFARGEQLTLQQTFDLFRGTLFSDEVAAVLTAIVRRESNYTPFILNPNESDWSLGLLQGNVYAHGNKSYYLPIGNKTMYGWRIGYRHYARDGVTDLESFKTKARQFRVNRGEQACFDLIDPIIWIPLNQAYYYYTLITGKTAPTNPSPSDRIGQTPETAYIFKPWGDYGTDAKGPPYGFIGGTNFKDAVEVYKSTGKNPYLLKQFMLAMWERAPGAKDGRGYRHANQWLDGYVFKYGWANGGFTKNPNNPFAPTGNIYEGYDSNVTLPAGGIPQTNTGLTGGGGAGSPLGPVNPILFNNRRSSWQAPDQPITGPPIDWAQIDTVVIHYTGVANTPDGSNREEYKQFLRNAQNGYINERRYSLGYNAAVNDVGESWEIRGWDIKAAATRDHNTHTFAIMITVDGERAATAKAVTEVKRLIAEAERQAGRRLQIVGHADLGQTSCPGDGIKNQIKAGAFNPGTPVPPPRVLPSSPGNTPAPPGSGANGLRRYGAGFNKRSEGPGGSGIPNLNGYKAFDWGVEWINNKSKYCTINQFRFGQAYDGVRRFRAKKDGVDTWWDYPAGTICFDCSGFVISVYRQAGVDIPAVFGVSGSQQVPGVGADRMGIVAPDPSKIQPLDIVVYKPNDSGVGHLSLVYAVEGGVVKNFGTASTRGIDIGTVNFDRVPVNGIRRILATGYFVP